MMIIVGAASGVLSNDTDDDEDSLTAVLVATSTSGVLSLSGHGGFTYEPQPDLCGSDSFTYYADDSVFTSSSTTVTLHITCVNDDPVVDDAFVLLAENESS
jgi:VCBS repeat-containing protein